MRWRSSFWPYGLAWLAVTWFAAQLDSLFGSASSLFTFPGPASLPVLGSGYCIAALLIAPPNKKGWWTVHFAIGGLLVHVVLSSLGLLLLIQLLSDNKALAAALDFPFSWWALSILASVALLWPVWLFTAKQHLQNGRAAPDRDRVA